VSHSDLPTLPLAVGLLVVGTVLLVFHDRLAGYWSKASGKPIPRGLSYFYLYLLGPVFLLTLGVLALLSVLLFR
jgi:hypothetical protein